MRPIAFEEILVAVSRMKAAEPNKSGVVTVAEDSISLILIERLEQLAEGG